MSDKQGGTLKAMRERISGYHVYDRHYGRVGKVDDLFVDADDKLEYIGLKLGGMFGSKTALVPMQLVRINERRDLIEIEADKEQIEAAPTFDKDEELTPDYEDRVRRHFGLQTPEHSGEGRSRSHRDANDGRFEERDEVADKVVDTEYGERAGARDGSQELQTRDSSSRSGLSVPERDRAGETEETGRSEVPEASGGSRARKLYKLRLHRKGGGENTDVSGGAASPGEDADRFR